MTLGDAITLHSSNPMKFLDLWSLYTHIRLGYKIDVLPGMQQGGPGRQDITGYGATIPAEILIQKY